MKNRIYQPFLPAQMSVVKSNCTMGKKDGKSIGRIFEVTFIVGPLRRHLVVMSRIRTLNKNLRHYM